MQEKVVLDSVVGVVLGRGMIISSSWSADIEERVGTPATKRRLQEAMTAATKDKNKKFHKRDTKRQQPVRKNKGEKNVVA